MAEPAVAQVRGARVLVVSNERVAARMAGPAIRAMQLARQLAARGAQVTLAAPEVPEPVWGDDELAAQVRLEAFGSPTARGFRRLGDAHDVVVTQPQRVDVLHGLAGSRARIVADLYVPSFVERLAQLGGEPGDARVRGWLLERDRLEYAAAVRLADACICASERQRDHWLGALGQAGRLVDLGLLARDPRGEGLVGVVPFGVDDDPATGGDDPALRLRGRLVPQDAVVLVWTGGLWNWFDPVVVVEALARAREREPRLHLVVMGYRHPEAHQVEQAASRRMRERAEQLGLLESGAVVLCDEWVPYAQRGAFLLDADAAVSAHVDGLETRLSYRTRLLDHLWAGLPTVMTSGGDLADELAAHGAALEVAPGDVDGWTAALEQVAGDAALRERLGRAARELGDAHRWSRIVEPLVRIVGEQAAGVASPPRRPITRRERLAYLRLLVRVRAATKGVTSLAAAARDAR